MLLYFEDAGQEFCESSIPNMTRPQVIPDLCWSLTSLYVTSSYSVQVTWTVMAREVASITLWE